MNSDTSPVLPSDCYSSREIRHLLGHRNLQGEIIPITRRTLWVRRKRGKIPFIKFGQRVLMYPKHLIDAMLREAVSFVNGPAEKMEDLKM